MSALAQLDYEKRFGEYNWNTSDKISVPDIFFERHMTGHGPLDELFGGEVGGLLPVSSFTMTGTKGAGKSTFLLQYLAKHAANGVSVAYISNEEIIFMLSMACKRLGIDNVPLVNMNDIDRISDELKERKTQIAILDSFPGLVTTKTKRNIPQYVLTKIRELTSDFQNPLSIGTILHLTKAGTFKGSSDICHVVDINLELFLTENGRRIIKTSKNRTGYLKELELIMTDKGYDFSNNPDETQEIVEPASYHSVVMAMFNHMFAIDENEVAEKLGIVDPFIVLTEMENEGMLIKLKSNRWIKTI
jgi:predicted ATP-dependent serine protease